MICYVHAKWLLKHVSNENQGQFRDQFLGCNIDWRYTHWFLRAINIPVSLSFIWNFSILPDRIDRKEKTLQYDSNIMLYPSIELWVKLVQISSIISTYYFGWYWNHQQNNFCNFLGKILILPFKTFLEYLGSSISCNITFN